MKETLHEREEEFSPMRIAFDVDGVVLKSIDVILGHINDKTGRNLTPDDLAAWDLDPLGIDLRTLGAAVDHMYSLPRIEHYEGAVRVLSTIHTISEEPLLFITGRLNPDTARRQLEAMPWNPTVPEMVVTGGDRYKLDYLHRHHVDFIVEDDLKHVEEYLEAGFGVGLMLQPWNCNTAIPVTERFSGWRDLERWFINVAPAGSSRA
jgi:hypothetical protein